MSNESKGIELKDFTKQILKALNITDVQELPSALMKLVKTPKELKRFIKTYDKLTKDSKEDMLQGLYEFWLSNREELSQDYTPKSLAKLVGMLSNHTDEKNIYDMCCGMGSLTTTKYKNHESCNYILKELDPNVAPFLLFKLCYHRVNAKVHIGDVLLDTKTTEYIIRDGVLVQELPLPTPQMDTVISNPPFNLRLDQPVTTKEFTFKAKSQLNYAFVLRALESLTDTGVAVFIFPNGVLSSQDEKIYRKYLIDNDLLDVVITVPRKMFTNTDIPTTVLKIRKSKPEKRKNKVTLIKSQPTGLYKRKQKGEDHMKTRVYTKTFTYYTDDDLLEIADTIKHSKDSIGYSKTVTNQELKDMDYDIAPSRYIGLKPLEDKSRSFKDIITDIKHCDTRRGLVKLTINQTLAKNWDLETFEEGNNQSMIMFQTLRELLIHNPEKMGDLTLEDLDYTPLHYLQVSKKKNELKFEQNSKEHELSEMMGMMMQLWIQNVLMWNNEESNYIKELLDKMLPLLMEGTLNVEEIPV